MIFKPLRAKILMLLFATFSLSSAFSQDAQPDGKALFKAKCASCHNKNMKDDLTGPALGGFEERWADYPQEDLYAWIRNSQKQISDGHPKAVELWKEWSPTVMTPFTDLTDADIEQLLLFVDNVYYNRGPYKPKEVTVAGGGDNSGSKKSGMSGAMMGILFLVLAAFALALSRIIANLNHMSAVKAGDTNAKRKTFMDMLTSKSVIGFVIFALVIIGGYFTVNNAIDFGRQQGYAPEQPIKFSHETHAGVNKIDCQYCHDGARRSKHATIPGVNTCMNCHEAVKVGSTYGTAELSKIYASAGFNPVTGKYFEDYENVNKDTVKAMFAEWIESQYVASDVGKTKSEAAVSKFVANQLNGTKTEPGVASYIQSPIEWVRIHNLPDHAYFNHAQHVSVGKVECQDCHGKVEEMEVLQQYAPLSMGWCINCHRQTEVKTDGSDYYAKAYKQYVHDKEDGKIDKIAVEDIGGLECQKCHY